MTQFIRARFVSNYDLEMVCAQYSVRNSYDVFMEMVGKEPPRTINLNHVIDISPYPLRGRLGKSEVPFLKFGSVLDDAGLLAPYDFDEFMENVCIDLAEISDAYERVDD